MEEIRPETEVKVEEKVETEVKEKKKDKKEKNTSGFFRRRGRFFKGLTIGLVIGVLATYFLGMQILKGNVFGKVGQGKEYVDKLLSERLFGYTAADFSETILGEAEEHQELIVLEQPVEVHTTITKAGLGDLKIFSKTKDVVYPGTGVFTVDLSTIDSDHIQVDQDNMTVTIYINKATLQYITLDNDNVVFEDTERGALSFGDIKMTVEQQNELEKSVKEEMKENLETDEVLALANEAAIKKTWQTFQPLIISMDPFYSVEVKFIEEA